MNCEGGTLKPQTEENIQEARWVKKEALAQYIANTYPSIKEVFVEYGII